MMKNKVPVGEHRGVLYDPGFMTKKSPSTRRTTQNEKKFACIQFFQKTSFEVFFHGRLYV